MSREPIHGVGRRGVHAHVVDVVGRRIVSGAISPGAVLDLNALELEFGVSHTAMREAIKVLTAKQLIDARPKLGTYVLPRVYWNLLDPDVMVWRDHDLRLQDELAEVRALMEPAAAELAAERASPEDVERMRQALARMEISSRSDDERALVEVAEADVDFHVALAAASGNELFEHFQRMLTPAMRARDLVTLPNDHAHHFLEEHSRVLAAIAAGDTSAARAAMADLVQHAKEDFRSGLVIAE